MANENTVSIAGLNKGAVLAALYNASKPQGMGFMHYDSTPMTAEEGQMLYNQSRGRFDYLKGRVMKIDLTKDDLYTWGYDRDNGNDAAAKAIAELRASGNPNTEAISKTHQKNTLTSAIVTSEHLDDRSGWNGDNFHLGLSDVKKHLQPKLRPIVGDRNG